MQIPPAMLTETTLGNPKQYFPARRTGRAAARLLGIFLLAAGLLLMAYAAWRGWQIWGAIGPVRALDWLWLPAAAAGLLMVSGWGMTRYARSERQPGVMLFSGGLRVTLAGETIDWPWSAITALYINRQRVRVWMFSDREKLTATLCDRDGRRAKLGENLVGLEALVEVVSRETGRLLLEQLLQTFAQGVELGFDALHLQADRGVKIGPRWLPWSQIEAIELAQGVVRIYLVEPPETQGLREAQPGIPASTIANLNVFLALAGQRTAVRIRA